MYYAGEGAVSPMLVWLTTVVAVLLFAAVIVLGYLVTDGHFRTFDIAISHALNMQRGAVPDWFILLMQGISWIGGGIQRYVIVAVLTITLWRWWGWGWATSATW